MATETLLEELKAHQTANGLSLRKLAVELGVTQPYLSMLFAGKRRVTVKARRKIEQYLKPIPSFSLAAILEQFIRSSVHNSLKTIQTLEERLQPFIVCLAGSGVFDPLHIRSEHIEKFLSEIGRGRRGKPLSSSSLFGFAKDVQAFVNFIDKVLAPVDWPNPVRYLRVKQPQITIHPLSQSQIDTLLTVAESQAITPILKARHRALLYLLLDGALRVSELINLLKTNLNEDGILRLSGKGGKEREVALFPTTIQAIGNYLSLRSDSANHLFVTEDGNRLSCDCIKSLFHRWKKSATLAFQGVRLSAHTLRHTSATLRRIGGMSEGDLQTFLGHCAPEMTRHYSAFALSKAANMAAIRTSPMQALTLNLKTDGIVENFGGKSCNT